MKATVVSLIAEYAASMEECVAGGGEAALSRAYEAGRRALAEGVGVLEMLAAHHHTVIKALRQQTGEQAKEQALNQAIDCFAESLSPFEMVLRGAQESNARLRQSLSNVQRVEEQLRRQNEKVTAAHQAVEKERHRYQALFDFAPDGYLVTGLEGAIREANAAAAVLLHTPKELLPGQSLIEFVVDADREAFREQLRAFHSGTLERVEDWQISVQPRNQPPIPAALTVAAERGAPATASLRWLIRDVTERKRLEKERTRSLIGQAKAQAARRFQFLAEASSLLVGSLDVEASLASVAYLAVPYLADWCFINVIDPDRSLRQLEVAHADPMLEDLAKELKSHCLFRPHARMRRDPGLLPNRSRVVDEIGDTWINDVAESAVHAELLKRFSGRSAMVVPLRIHERLIGVLTFISAPGARRYRPQDLSLGDDLAHRCALALENTRLYREVSAERDKAEKASRAKDEFLAILSHELRNPLMPVIGWTRMLKGHQLIMQDPLLAEGVKSMERNAQTLGRLVEDCLDLARISEGKIQMERKPVDLNQIIRASIESVHEMAGSKGLRLFSEVTPGSILLLGDATRLEQVVMNLLVNAIKYTEAGGQIWVGCMATGDEVEMEVRDTGIGIHPAFLEQIFQPFRRGTTSWLTHQSGLGLGLAIARQIVEMHKGRIWAESKGLDFGSTFRVRLPMSAVAATESVLDLAGIRGADQSRGVRLLLIEDSPDILFLLRVELELMGHEVFTAADGIAGLKLAKAELPDLIISDIKMPGIDGYELIREIRAAPELCGTPAIALTGFGAKTDFDRAIAAGFDACVSKPAEPEEISALIAKLTEKRTLVNNTR